MRRRGGHHHPAIYIKIVTKQIKVPKHKGGLDLHIAMMNVAKTVSGINIYPRSEMALTIGIHRNSKRKYKICTGHSRLTVPWALIKDHLDVQAGSRHIHRGGRGKRRYDKHRTEVRDERKKRHQRNWRLFGRKLLRASRRTPTKE